jgi:hypothetical protein
MALDLLADITLLARVDLLGIADPATNRFRFHYTPGFPIAAAKVNPRT